jgi:site-specific DNA recombinase
MQRAIIYTRVSTEEQGDNYSLGSQDDACRRYAEQHSFSVVAALQDMMSGAKLERPGLNKVRELLRLRTADAVIVYCSDRLTRSLAHSLLLREELREAGVALHCVTKGETAATPEGNLFESIEAAFGEFERLKIKERTRRGQRRRLESGLAHGDKLPFGYHYADEGRGTVTIDEEEAGVVRMIFGWYLDGLGALQIVGRLTELRIPTPSDRRAYIHVPKKRERGEWACSTITAIIKNPVYKGELHCKHGDDTIIVHVPPIVSPEQWAVAAHLREERYRRIIGRGRRLYILRGRVRCALCGSSCTGTQGGRGVHFYYRCGRIKNTFSDSLPKCSLPQFPYLALEDAVWVWIDTTVLNEEHIRAAVAGLDDDAEGERARVEAERTTLARQLYHVDAQIARLVELYAAGVFTMEEIAAQKAHLDHARASCRAALAELDARIMSIATAQERADELCDLVRCIRARIAEGLQRETMHQIINLLDVEVTLFYEGEAGRRKRPTRLADVIARLTLDETRLTIAGVSVETTTPCALGRNPNGRAWSRGTPPSPPRQARARRR